MISRSLHALSTLLPTLLITALPSLALSEETLAREWSQFRGPGGAANAADARTPLTWSADKNLIWRTPLPGRGASSPITWGDRIYLTAYTGYGLDHNNIGESDDLRLHVIALSRTDGKVLWDRQVKPGATIQPFGKRIADHGYATGTPACDASGVYAFFGTSGVVAFDPNGALKWRASVGDRTAGFGSASSPILHGDLLFVNASIESETLFALDKKTGEVAWEIPNVQKAWTTPTIVRTSKGDDELIISYKNTIAGIDPVSGKQLWTCDGIQDYVVPCAVSHDGVVFCIGGRRNQSIAVKTGGRGDVTETHTLWSKTIGANVTSPIYHEGRLYWASDKGIACCVDAKTGEEIYRERLPTRARIYASAILANNHLYVTTRDKGVVVLPASPKFEEVARNVIDGDESLLNATPAVTGDYLLLRSDRFLYCLGAK